MLFEINSSLLGANVQHASQARMANRTRVEIGKADLCLLLMRFIVLILSTCDLCVTILRYLKKRRLNRWAPDDRKDFQRRPQYYLGRRVVVAVGCGKLRCFVGRPASIIVNLENFKVERDPKSVASLILYHKRYRTELNTLRSKYS